MKTFQILAIALTALFAIGAGTPAEAKDRRHYRHGYGYRYNPLYGNYAYYHNGRGPTYGYWDRGYGYTDRTYSSRQYYSRPRSSIAFGGSRRYHHYYYDR